MMLDWLEARRHAARWRVTDMALVDSGDWALENGRIAHRTGGFFAVTGLEWITPDGEHSCQPYLDQQELGTLGFLVADSPRGRQLLVQAKLEPGNIGGVQVAPTCQATASNGRRLHGGEAPPFMDAFTPGIDDVSYDVTQSEQGTRFFFKHNRNVIREISEPTPAPSSHCWVDVADILAALRLDHVVNTDARSVLVCAPWSALVRHAPFSGRNDPFGKALYVSAHADSHVAPIAAMRAAVLAARAAAPRAVSVPLEQLDAWSISRDGLAPRRGGAFRVRHVRVEIDGREVPSWDQPIIDSTTDGRVDLICGRLDGVLHFLFRAQSEAGLRCGVELTPSLVVGPGSTDSVSTPPIKGQVIATCRQSEEGGRFFHDTNRYRIVDVGELFPPAPMSFWLTLRDIRHLIDESGWFTNEARSALSLLLPWL